MRHGAYCDHSNKGFRSPASIVHSLPVIIAIAHALAQLMRHSCRQYREQSRHHDAEVGVSGQLG
jgi:hypothetical protein